MSLESFLLPDLRKYDAAIAGASNYVVLPMEREAVEESVAKIKSIVAGLTIKPPMPVRPSKDNTGYTPGTVLKDGNVLTITAGKTYDGYKFINKTVKLNLAAGQTVTFKNCFFDGGSFTVDDYCLRADANQGRIICERCEFQDADDLVYAQGIMLKDCFLELAGGDAVKLGSNSEMIGCYVNNIGKNDGAHADGVQIRGAKNVTIRGNYFDMPTNVPGTSSNAAVFAQLDVKAIVVEKNWIRGGNFAVCVYDDVPDSTSRVTGNIFYRGTPRFGFGRVTSTVLWSGNTDENGVTVKPSDK